MVAVLAENRPEWPQNSADFEKNSSLLAVNFTRISTVGAWGWQAMLKWFFNLFIIPPQIFNQTKEFPTVQSLFFGLAQRGNPVYHSLGHPEIHYDLQRGYCSISSHAIDYSLIVLQRGY
jgi:hypothetical protein